MGVGVLLSIGLFFAALRAHGRPVAGQWGALVEGVQQHVWMGSRRPGPVSWAVDYAVYLEAEVFAVPDCRLSGLSIGISTPPGQGAAGAARGDMTHGAGT